MRLENIVRVYKSSPPNRDYFNVRTTKFLYEFSVGAHSTIVLARTPFVDDIGTSLSPMHLSTVTDAYFLRLAGDNLFKALGLLVIETSSGPIQVLFARGYGCSMHIRMRKCA